MGKHFAGSVVFVVLGACVSEPDLAAIESSVDVSAFQLPSLSDGERADIVHRYDALDPGDQIPRGLLEDTIIFFDVNQALIPNPDYFVVVDLSLYSGKDRLWLVDLASGAVEPHKVAHGDGSDPDNNGYATLFSNVEGSHQSSLGFALSGEIYDGTHVHSMRLDGLSVDGSPNDMANTAMRDRLVVMHEATYVDDGNASQQGRSNGCLALDPSIEVSVVDRIHDGALIYTAISELAPPVGRASTNPNDPPANDPPSDDPGEPPADGSHGGCAAGAGAGPAFALAVLGLRRRRRQR